MRHLCRLELPRRGAAWILGLLLLTSIAACDRAKSSNAPAPPPPADATSPSQARAPRTPAWDPPGAPSWPPSGRCSSVAGSPL